MTDLLSIAHAVAASLLAAEAGGQGAAPAGGAPANPMSGIWPLLPIVVIMIAFFWFTSRSQKKRERKRQEMLSAIKPKDDVTTIGGIFGRVVQVKDDAFVLRVDDEKDVKITVSKQAVSRKVGEPEPE